MLEAFFLWIDTPRAHENGMVERMIEEALTFEHPQSPEAFPRQLEPFMEHEILDRLPERLASGPATITELAEPFGMSLTGMKKHVRVLQRARLVTTEKVGRTRQCSLGEHRLEDVQAYVESYRGMVEERLDRLGELLEREKGAQQP